jgi:NADH pyrophosphatase NudC (nudix superfamily)
VSDPKPEDEYFRKLDAEAKARLRAQMDAEEAGKAAEALRAQHHHRCGKCGNPMATKAFRGIEIEECGSCGAVLLDPGELGVLAGSDQTGVVASFFSTFGGRKR